MSIWTDTGSGSVFEWIRWREIANVKPEKHMNCQNSHRSLSASGVTNDDAYFVY